MYGLVIESLVEYIRQNHGQVAWEEIQKDSKMDYIMFSSEQMYPESVIPGIVSAAGKYLNMSEENLMRAVGEFFIAFVGRYGYDRVLSVLGRHLRDFLNGLDNLHEYLRFSYPQMQPPSFSCEDEDREGLRLHYRTRRRGFLHYTMGQIRAIGQHYYRTPVDIDIVSQKMDGNVLHVVFQLKFDNTGYDDDQVLIVRDRPFPPIAAHVFFDIFPFSIFFDETMTISVLGSSLQVVMPGIIGRNIIDVFSLDKPLIRFTWASILSRLNNNFELRALEAVKGSEKGLNDVVPFDPNDINEDRDMKAESSNLRLKGQMLYMDDWNGIIYLGSPVMPDLDVMMATGLYINDLSLHDFSRDLMLAGTQQSVELKLALDQEQQKSKRLEESMRKLDEEMKRTDELLYQMIPKTVADRLRSGDAAVNTCEVFDLVTILFSDVVTFTEMCSRITPMEVVSLLNAMYSLFDRLTEIHGVYKVETIGDAYMVVAGAPERVDNHAQRVADMALDMLQVITGLKDPSTNNSIRIRVGIHSGTVVAGVVGIKMPRYCLFGDAVNTASRMESNSEPMKIQVSLKTRSLLPSDKYFLVDRGVLTVKGKGRVQAFWLTGKKDYLPPTLQSESMPPGSPQYSPVMVGEKILKRDSLAYNTLSPLSTPYPSRPTTADVGQPTTQSSKSSIPPLSRRPSIPAPAPLLREPEPSSDRSLNPKSPSFTPVALQRNPQEVARSPQPPPVAAAPAPPLAPPAQQPLAVPAPAPQVMNVSPMTQLAERFTDPTKVGTVSPLTDPTKLDPASIRPQPQQVVPHVHCSIQCQSTSCGLQ